MAFGKTMTPESPQRETDQTTENVYLNLKEGTRVIRIRSDEVRYKVVWLDNVTTPKGKAKRPVITSVMRDGRWVGDYWNNPLETHFDATLGERSRENKARASKSSKDRFVCNVLDRTEVVFEGTDVFYPGSGNKFEKGSADLARPHNKIVLLEGSNGKEGGKHFLQAIKTCFENALDFKTGKNFKDIVDFDLRIITTSTNDTYGINRTVAQGFDSNPLPAELEELDLYDLTYLKPWPEEAQEELLAGEDYYVTAEKYGIQLYPKLSSGDVPF
jgi:hypothetical protein